MGLNRYYCRPINDTFLELIGPELHHMTRVLRQQPGEEVELFDGEGTLARARIESTGHKAARLTILERQTAPAPAGPMITLLVSMARNERFEWLVSKCCELGVDRIWPVLFERTVKQASNPKAQQRYFDLAVSAAKQCKRLYLPRIEPPAPLSQVLQEMARQPETTLYYGHFGPEAADWSRWTPLRRDTALLVGPEGGFTEDELQRMNQAGATPIRLTQTILRIETAAIAFAAIATVTRDALAQKITKIPDSFCNNRTGWATSLK